MAYDLSEEELLQLIGIKAGVLADTVGSILESSDEQLKSEVVQTIHMLSRDISNLAIDLKNKVDLRDDPLPNTWRQ